MKALLTLLVLAGVSFVGGAAMAQQQNVCQSICRNDGGDQLNDKACQVAGELAGLQGCSRYNMLGCNWYASTPIQHPGTCKNEGGNPSFDSACQVAGQIGEGRCKKYNSLGCVWYPGEVTCQ